MKSDMVKNKVLNKVFFALGISFTILLLSIGILRLVFVKDVTSKKYSVTASTPHTTQTPTPTAKNTIKKQNTGFWSTEKKQIIYLNNNKKSKGLVTIDGKSYFFDKKGHQKTGWIKINKQYYYFKIATGSKGYMIKNKKVDGIKLKKSGVAKKGSKRTLKRLKVLTKCSLIANLVTRPRMKKKNKLKKIFNFMIKHYHYAGPSGFRNAKDWEVNYASYILNNNCGQCYHFGSLFAFFANAVGYKNAYAVASGGHGWTEIGKYVYDPTWHMVDKKHSYYKMPLSLSGKNGRPYYKCAGNRRKKV